MLTTLTFNLVNTAIRRERLHGREHVVAPMAMLTEGVHTGSNGPLLYRKEECARAVPAWNMKPIVVYHPEMNGRGVSACDPVVLEKQQVGVIMNTRWDGKLRAEAWIDVSRATVVDPRVLAALEENRIMEVSTGLFTDNVGDAGEWEGIAYNAEARNHQPDHLALLPDKIGACSVADGAGLLQLNETAAGAGVDVTRMLAREMDVLRRMVGNAMSHSNMHAALVIALRAKTNATDGMWVVDVYDKFFIYEDEKAKKLYRLDYTKSNAGVEITGDPQEVMRVTEYRTATGEFVGNTAHKQYNERSNQMEKKELVDGLIANGSTQWGEGDREALMNMEEALLQKLAPVENFNFKSKGKGKDAMTEAEKKAMMEEEEKKAKDKAKDKTDNSVPVTMEAFLATAPPEFRDVLANSFEMHQQTKGTLIEKIVANERNKFSREFLTTKPLQELQGLASLMGEPKDAQTNNAVPMFYGAATPASFAANVSATEETPLVAPTMNFKDN